MGLAAHAVHHVAQLTVVHVHDALPRDLAHVDAQLVALLNVVVQHGGQQVVGRADGVEIAGEVQIDVFHGHDLGVAAAGRAALDAEDGPERRLAQRHHHVLADLAQAVGQADRGRRLAFAGGRGRDGRDQHELAVGTLAVFEEIDVVDLGLGAAVELQILPVDPRAARHFLDRKHGR